MRIQESAVQLAASHEAQSSHTVEVRTIQSFRRLFDQLSQTTESDESAARQRLQTLLQSLVDAILAAMDGKKCGLALAAEETETLPPSASAGGRRSELTWQRTITECIRASERTSVCGRGTVKTCDGREIDFSYGLDLERHYESRKTYEESGKIQLQDPLVLNFGGKSCELTEDRIAFDLNADGLLEQIPGLAAGSCFLVFDRNGNGKADDGSELFGVRSGNGFADLDTLDKDRNGWIDEADPVWNQLALWSGDRLVSLAERGVGALYTGAVDAPFSLKTAANELLGQIRMAGLYLMESGESGSLQQVDLAVAKGTETTEKREARDETQNHS